MAAAKEALRNYTMVGGCYDILKVDPVDLTTNSAKFPNAFDLGELEDIPDQKWSKPTGLLYRAAFGGGSDRSVSEISSSYDYQRSLQLDGSISVSDPTGAAFSATMSASFQQVQQKTSTRSTVMTQVSMRVNQFHLQVDDDKSGLSPELRNALQQLPDSASTAYDKFISRFGTHYVKHALFGGRATQKISVSTDDYLSLYQEGIDVKAQAEATFDIVKTAASAHASDKRSEKFTSARSLTVEQVVYVGGAYTQGFLDMWAMQVPDQPMPIAADFAPLYDLCEAERVLDPSQWEDERASYKAKQSLLKNATESYLAAKGIDLHSAVLHYGDVVSVAVSSPGTARLLSCDETAGFARTVPVDGAAGVMPDPNARWTLLNVSNRASKDEVRTAPGGPDVMLKVAGTGKLLDAQAGSDERTYVPGRGLAGASDDLSLSTRWIVDVVGAGNRTALIDGDIVRLKSRWRAPRRPEPGYLLGEAKPDDPGQRVYSFGDSQQTGVFWVLRRVTDSASVGT